MEVTGPRPPSLLRLGVTVWLASELMFFAALFAAWFGLRSTTEVWPPESVELPVVRTAVATALLVLSSFTYHRAVRGAEEDDERRLVRWTAVTFVLGVVFLANQALEYAETDMRISDGPFEAMFFVLTGFHGLHVLGGLVLMLAVLGVVVGRTARAPRGDVVAASVAYWHFVDVVWIGLFATVYLLR